MRRLEHIALWGGVAAPLLYTVTVLAGGAVLPGYDPLVDTISALTASGRHGVKWIEAGFGLYNLLLMAFAGTGWTLADRAWRRVFLTLMVTAGAGLLMWPFAMDMRGAPVTPAGLAHLGLAAVASVSTIVAVSLSIFAEQRQWRRLSAYCLVLMALSGLATAGSAALDWPVVGLLERVTIGAFMLWLGTTAVRYAMASNLAPARPSS